MLDRAVACAHKIATLPRRAVEDTKRVINMHLERSILATIDHALAAEDRSVTSPELRANLDRLLARRDKETEAGLVNRWKTYLSSDRAAFGSSKSSVSTRVGGKKRAPFS